MLPTTDEQIEQFMTKAMDDTRPEDGGVAWVDQYLNYGFSAFGHLFSEFLERKLFEGKE
ncbi:hypothetical protein ACH47B_13200 [Rhodococcus sp. NPDC019627]|uniref:hypothetical protein n=1 Tax=unclassified Rhodococcus (in: high G+C Gram-positive bacteria) TaxID=192944 RepID=UPI0033E505C0